MAEPDAAFLIASFDELASLVVRQMATIEAQRETVARTDHRLADEHAVKTACPHRRNLKRRSMAVIACIITFSGAASACSAPSPPRSRTVQNESDLVLPLDAYDLTSEQRSTVQTARYLLIERCVTRYGLKFEPHNTKPIAYPKNASYLGWLRAKKVAEYGYSGPPGQREEAAAAVSGIRGYDIPRKQDAVHVGTVKTYRGRAVPSEGCDGWAQRKLNGNAPGPDGKVPAKPHIYKNLYVLMDDAAIAAYNHPQVRAAGSAWSECMRASGFIYPDPPSARP